MYNKNQDIYHQEMYALHPTTSRPPQSKAELGRVVLPSCRREAPSSERIVTLHVLEQVPLSTRSNVPRRSRPDFASVNAPIGFVGTVLLIPVVWSHNRLTINLRKRFLLCNYVKQQIYSRHKTLFSKNDFSCHHLASVTTEMFGAVVLY